MSDILEESWLPELRPEFKAALWVTRGEVLTIHGYKPICQVCAQPINDVSQKAFGGDLHEAIFTRGDVQGEHLELRRWVNHPCNVDFRHNTCPGLKLWHTPGHGSTELWGRFAIHIIAMEGEGRVVEYVTAMVREIPVLQPTLFRLTELIEKGEQA